MDLTGELNRDNKNKKWVQSRDSIYSREKNSYYNNNINNNNTAYSNNSINNNRKYLTPNPIICTTAAKAYGRAYMPKHALGLLSWLDSFDKNLADSFMITAIIYVCAKSRMTAQTEWLFWREIPMRNLQYSTVYMYYIYIIIYTCILE